MAKDPTARILLLEKHLTKKVDSFNPNPLLELVSLARHAEPEVVHSAVWALHRVFIKLVGDGRLGRAIFKENSEDDEEVDLDEGGGAVRDWIMKRLGEYVDILGGLLRDSEEGLRVGHLVESFRRILTLQSSAVPLLFSLLPSLSLAASPPPGPAVIHIPYIRLVIRHLLFPSASLRGSKVQKGSLKTVAEYQVEENEGVLPEDVANTVQEDFWAKYDDLRWAFFREAV